MEKHKSHLLDIVKEIEGGNKLIKELFDAAKNNDLNFFFFPDDETIKITDKFFDRWKKFRKLFQKVMKTLGNDWILELYILNFIYYLYCTDSF